MSEEVLRRGATLDRFEIRELIGQGGMGEVYRAWDTVLQRDVAIKVLRLRDDDMRKRFKREAEAIGKVDNENVVQIHDFKVAADPPYIVMEYLRGMSLREVLAKNGAMSIERAVGVALGVCRGVAACHRLGIIHRDLKPANVFLAETAHYGTVVKVLDFGVAKPRYHADVTGPGQIAGTPAYVAPEILGGFDADETSDQYGIGLLLYVALTGKPPFGNKERMELGRAILRSEFVPPKEVRPDLPEALVAVLLRALNVDRSARFSSVIALARSLIPFASEEEREVSQEVFGEGELPETSDSTTTLDKAVLGAEGSTRVVAAETKVAALARQSAAPSDAVASASPPPLARNVVVPVAPMEEGRLPKGNRQSFSTPTDVSSSMVAGRKEPTVTHAAGIIETARPKRSRGDKGKRGALLVWILVGSAAVLAVLATSVVLLVKGPPLEQVQIELPRAVRPTKSVALPDAGILADARSTAEVPKDAHPTAEVPTHRAAEVPKDVPTHPAPMLAASGLGRAVAPLDEQSAVHPHARPSRRLDNGRRLRKRRIEYTKDGSPILW